MTQSCRIYGISYEGHYYDLRNLQFFLFMAESCDEVSKQRIIAATWTSRRYREIEFAFRTGDLEIAEMDKGDFSIRLDIETGQLEDILLAPPAQRP